MVDISEMIYIDKSPAGFDVYYDPRHDVTYKTRHDKVIKYFKRKCGYDNLPCRFEEEEIIWHRK